MESNGTTPELSVEEHVARARVTRERVIAELRDLLTDEQRIHDDLAEQLAAARTRRDGYQRALRELTGEPKRATTSKPKSSKDGSWVISDKKIATVWESVRHRTDTFTAANVAEGTPGLSPESARRALHVLRERELLRAAGTGRGGGTLLAVMPGAGEQELADAA